ncbi:12669_t:CDS:1, partial [Dentiscutata erythropus]
TSIHKTSLIFEIEPKQFRNWSLKKKELILARSHIHWLNTGSYPKYSELEVELSSWIHAL